MLANDSKLRRRIKRLLDKLIVGPSVMDGELVIPSLGVYKTMIRREGLMNNSELAFRLFKEALAMLDRDSSGDVVVHGSNNITSLTYKQETVMANMNITSSNEKKGLYRCLIEACVQADDQVLLTKAKLLLHIEFEGCNSHQQESTLDDDNIEPTSTFNFNGQDYIVKNGPSNYSKVTRKLLSVLLNTSSLYRRIDITSLPERGMRIPTIIARDILSLHCEKQALGGLLQLNSLSGR